MGVVESGSGVCEWEAKLRQGNCIDRDLMAKHRLLFSRTEPNRTERTLFASGGNAGLEGVDGSTVMARLKLEKEKETGARVDLGTRDRE